MRTMMIISEYDLKSISETEFFCESHEDPACPCCGERLCYRDRRRRIMRSYGGETFHLWLRRLYCKHCGRLHLELPDILVPQKHYSAEIIENVVDEVSTAEDESTEDYPCQDTMLRWKHWLAVCGTQIEGRLRSIGDRLLGLGRDILEAGGSILQELRKDGSGWLGICLRAIYNSGGRLAPVSSAPAFPGVPERP